MKIIIRYSLGGYQIKNSKKSVSQSLEKLRSLADNLDNGGEEISHPKLNRKKRKCN